MATVANGGTRVDAAPGEGRRRWRRGLEAGAGAGRRSRPMPMKPENAGRRCTTGCGWSVNAAGTGGRARIAGRDVAGKTGTAQVISNQGRQAPRGRQRPGTCATTAGSCSSRRATTREIAGVIFARARRARLPGARPSRSTSWRPTSRRRKAGRLPELTTAAHGPQAAAPTPARRGAAARVADRTPRPSSADVRAPPLLPHRLGCCSAPSWRCARIGLAHDLQRRPVGPTGVDCTRRSTPSALALSPLVVLPRDRLPDARRQVAPHLRRRCCLRAGRTCCSSAPCAGGARRWIDLGPFNLQPSEFAKAGVALVLAKFFGESRRRRR